MLKISQSRLAMLSGVSRFKICLCELGDLGLNETELSKIRHALQDEAARFRDDLTAFAGVGS
jgi:hypothetical protein